MHAADETGPQARAAWPATALVVLAAAAFSFAFAHPFTTPKALTLAALLAFFAFRARSRPRWPALAWAVALWPPVTGLWALDPRGYAGALGFWALCLLAARTVPLSANERDAIRLGLTWGGLVAAAYLLAQKMGLDPLAWEPGAAAGSVFGNPNFAAHFMLLALCLGRLPGGAAMRWLCRLALLAGIALSASRGAWLATVVYGAVMAVRVQPRLRWAVTAGALVLALGLGWFFCADLTRSFGYASAPASWVAEFQTQPGMIEAREPWFRGKRLSLMTRAVLFGNSAAMVPAFSFAGAGMGQFHVHYPRFAGAWADDVHLSEAYRAKRAHNALLDAAIQLGLPWLAAALWLLARLWRRTRSNRDYWLAAALQGGIALFSLNYVNPMILVPLILLCPLPAGERPGRAPLWPALLLSVLLATATLDWQAARAARAANAAEIPAWFAAERARALHREGAAIEAWHAQWRAYRRDPDGPETVFNLGLAAWEMADRASGPWRELAVRAWLFNRRRHPFYAPAETRLAKAAGGAFGEAATRLMRENEALDRRAAETAFRDLAQRLNEAAPRPEQP